MRFSNRLFFIRWLCLRDEDGGERAEREKSYQPKTKTNHRAQRNRVFRPINPLQERIQARTGAGSVFVLASRSRRRIAFNFPPNSRNKQVKYIQVSKIMSDASAR